MDVRDTLFGDMPLAAWSAPGRRDGSSSPWREFADAEERRAAGDRERALSLLTAVTKMPGLEARHYLQAWDALRAMGSEPPAGIATQVLGVVMEVSIDGGTDLLAAYADHHARYYNHGGRSIAWEAPDARLDGEIAAVLSAGARIVPIFARSTGPRPPRPEKGRDRISVLTPGGIHAGELGGDAARVSGRDELSAAFMAGTRLMQRMIALTDEKR